MAEHRYVEFRYDQGQLVSWAGVGRWHVSWRRWTERDILSPLVEYGLVLSDVEPPRGRVIWVAEADVLPVESEATHEAAGH